MGTVSHINETVARNENQQETDMGNFKSTFLLQMLLVPSAPPFALLLKPPFVHSLWLTPVFLLAKPPH